MREFLQGPNASLDKIEADLTAPKSAFTQKQTYEASLNPLTQSVTEARLDFTLNLDAMASSTEFRRLDKFVRRTRETAYEVISEIGDINRDIAPLEAAQTLIGSIRGHVAIVETIESGGKAGVPGGAEIKYAKDSFSELGHELKAYEDSLERTFDRYRRP